MGKFVYKAKNQTGQTVAGTLDAPDAKSVSIALRNQGLFVVDIKAGFSPFSFIRERFEKRIGLSTITNFTRQLAVMVSAGLTITEALTTIRNQTTDKQFEKLVSDLLISVEAGLSFSKALEEHKHVFSSVYIAVVASGETSGLFDQTLMRLADTLEREREFRGKIRNALLYPAIILIGVAIVIAIMMLFVIPQMSILYDQLGIELPLTTQIVVAISRFFVSFWYVFVLFLGGSFFFIANWKKTESSKRVFDALMLKIPFLGDLERGSNLTELTRTLGLLIGAGTPIIFALTSIAKAMSSSLFTDAIFRVAKKVEKGLSLANAFSQEEVLPPLLAQTARVGEETGKVDEVMIKVSAYFENEVDREVKALTTVLEPILLVILGFVVGFLMISVIMPIYGLTQAL